MTCACGDKPKYSPGDELVWFEGAEVPKSSLSKDQLASIGLGAEPIATASASSSGLGTGVLVGLAMGLVIGGVLGVYLSGISEQEREDRRRLVQRRREAY
jgi:hypothetical protein